VGGNWNNDLNAGLWYVNCNNAASNTNTNIGARLAKDNMVSSCDAHGRTSRTNPSGFSS
jgi:hypothetical protein